MFTPLATTNTQPSAARYSAPRAPRRTIADRIIAGVADRHGLTVAELTTATRAARNTHAREEAVYELTRRTTLTLPQIAQKFGLKDGRAVLRGVRAYERRQKPALTVADLAATRTHVAALRAQVEAGKALLQTVLKCQQSNTPEWMTVLAAELNRYAKATGEPDRVVFERGRILRVGIS